MLAATSAGNPRGDNRYREALFPAAIGLGALAVYVRSLYPDLAGGDSGELTAAAATGGVIHPPGYPLYALLARALSWLPMGTVAWRVNLLSAVCDAGAAALLALAVARWSGSRGAGLTSAALFALSPLVWTYAVSAEVFALNNLFCALLLWLAVLYDERARRRYALLFAAAFGLALCNHHTIVFTALPLAAWMAWRARREPKRGPMAGRVAASFAAGLLPYLYLPIAARSNAVVTWGEASAWPGFWTHVLRREYGTFQLAVSGIAEGANPRATAAAWAHSVFDQIGGWGLALAAVGLVVCARSARRKPLAIVLVVAPLVSVGVIVLLGNLPVSDSLHREIVARFWQQPLVAVVAVCGLGVAELGRRVHRRAPVAIGAAVAAVALVARFPAMSRHDNRIVRSYGAEILRMAPPGALMLTRGDMITNSVRYLQVVEGMRPDVRVVDLELLGFTWYARLVASEHPEIVLPGPRYMPGAADGFFIVQLLDANYDRALPIVLCGGTKTGDLTAAARYGRWPLGVCERVLSGSQPVSIDDWVAQSEAALPQIDFAGQARPDGSSEQIVWNDYWQARYARAAHLVDVAGAEPSRRRYLGVAADILEGIARDDPEPPPYVFKTLAVSLGRQGLDTPEQRARALAAWKKYLASDPKDDPQRPAIEAEAQRLASGQQTSRPAVSSAPPP